MGRGWSKWSEGRFLRKICEAISTDLRGFCPFFWPLAHFLPTFFRQNGQQKPSICKGLRAQNPLVHFFSLIKRDKKLNNIINMGRKSGQVVRRGKRRSYEQESNLDGYLQGFQDAATYVVQNGRRLSSVWFHDHRSISEGWNEDFVRWPAKACVVYAGSMIGNWRGRKCMV